MGQIIHEGCEYNYTVDYFKHNADNLLKESTKCTPDRNIKKITVKFRLETLINIIKLWKKKK